MKTTKVKMHVKRILPSLLLAVSSVTFTGSASAEPLAGDTKLACEAILCLATGSPPGECTPALRKFFSIWSWKLSDTLRGRSNFLNLCPTANDDKTKSLVAAIAEGAGQCDAASLNVNLTYSCGSGDSGITCISPVMPQACKTYAQHPYTRGIALPQYVGDPMRGGLWADASTYQQVLAAYNARLAQEAAAAAAPQDE
jgi:hypothetical protein